MKRILTLALAVATAAALVGIGRWQENRDVRRENADMARLFTLAAKQRIPDGWRIDGSFRCLLYRLGANPFAYELCFDPAGALVEAIDRRSGLPVASTLRFQTSRAALHVSSSGLDVVLREMRAFVPAAVRGSAVRYPQPAELARPVPPPLPRIPPGSGLPGARG